MSIDSVNDLNKPRYTRRVRPCLTGEELEKFAKYMEQFQVNEYRSPNADYGLFRKIDFEYNTSDELLEQISKRYNMKKLEPGEKAQILNMLREGGVISNREYWLGLGVVPIDIYSDDVGPEYVENVVDNYYLSYKAYWDKYSPKYKPEVREKLQDSVQIHEKIGEIFRQIQSYR